MYRATAGVGAGWVGVGGMGVYVAVGKAASVAGKDEGAGAVCVAQADNVMVSSKMREDARDSLRSAVPPAALELLRKARSGSQRADSMRATASAPSPPPARDRGYWFQSKREEIREMCLDCPGSSIWNYVDRDKFEEYTAIPGGPPLQKSKYLGGLYIALTLFSYETFNRDTAAV